VVVVHPRFGDRAQILRTYTCRVFPLV
jgi:hypothetical protein